MPFDSLLVFSHLRWNFVYQRPQHLISRLARRRRVFFIEEPIHDPPAAPHWEYETPQENLTICRPHSPEAEPGFHAAQLPVLRRLMKELIEEEKLEDYAAWFYTPMAVPLLNDLQPGATIYDCMDELSAFRFAPPELLEHEASLLRQADLVFTGGPSLYRHKKDRHPSVHCFPSSVDLAHFGKARNIAEPADQAGVPRPRFGFFGVIDERLDVPLLDRLAQEHPEWQIVLVGPVVKIDPSILPRHQNIHYFGQRDYAQLPAYLSGWDVCLLPFARNESTRFRSACTADS